ncbi:MULTISPECIES: sulfite exporter TauE/SafE family protein [unclassified Ruegeria]|uniref:sulfite exporter TauE/SafE family protein n=1 Tax=unclassified Ruegeria TaxID=2625375 RepID=UPI001487A350|nr:MULTISPECIES: sulfite exporter TauE/SafE family protein [unclassified Ruegeria]
MPELFGQSPQGLAIIIVGALLGGIVRGFSGFGTALVFLPIASPFLGPFGAIIALVIMDVFGPLPNLRRAWADVNKPDLARLLLACGLILPVGLWLLGRTEPEVFRYVVSGLSLTMLVILIFGLRYRGTVTGPMVFGTGAAAGFLGGIAGLPGPAVILFYMSRPLPVAVIRATILLFLLGFDVLMLGYLTGMGELSWTTASLGLVLAIPNVVGNLLGGWVFRPEKEHLYRGAAYVVIAAAALSGLPIWS